MILSSKFFLVLAFASVAFGLENPCKKDGKQYHIHPELPGKYIQCTSWGQMFTFSCPSPLVFNEDQQACDTQSKSIPAIGGSTTVAPTFTSSASSFQQIQDQSQNQQLASVQQQLLQLETLKNQLMQQQQQQQQQQSGTTQQQQNGQTGQKKEEDQPVLVVSPSGAGSNTQSQVSQQNQQFQQPQFQNFQQTQQQQTQQPFQQFQQPGRTQEEKPVMVVSVPSNSPKQAQSFQSSQQFSNQFQPQQQQKQTPTQFSKQSQEDKPIMVITGPSNTQSQRVSQLQSPQSVPQATQRTFSQQFDQQFEQPRVQQTFQVKSSQFVPKPQKFNESPDVDQVVESRSADESKLAQSQGLFKQPDTNSPFVFKPALTLPQLQKFMQQARNQNKALAPPTQPTQPTQQTDKSNTTTATNNNNNNKIRRFQILPVTSCSLITCPNGSVCVSNHNCPKCNPLCLPNDKKLSLENSLPLTCDNVKCPQTFECRKDPLDSLLKCLN